jgi:hypothetical protein
MADAEPEQLAAAVAADADDADANLAAHFFLSR